MADKFIIEGATFDGDGTSPNEATVTGGVGAWNSISYFEGAVPTYGDIVAGDTVFIRSKTSAGADITRTIAASVNLGSAIATQAAPISWVLDNGSVWSGVDGVLTYNCPSNFTVTFRHQNNFYALTPHNLQIIEKNSTANQKRTFGYGGHSTIDGVFFDASIAATTVNGVFVGGVSLDYREANLKNIKIKVGTTFGNAFTVAQGAHVKIINPDIELLNLSNFNGVFGTSSAGGFVEVIGGRIHGVGSKIAKPLVNTAASGWQVRIIGLQYPQEMKVLPNKSPPVGSGHASNVTVFGADQGIGSAYSEYWGDIDSRSDGYYPTLNARIPNSTMSGWSWKIYSPNASRANPGVLKFSKIYQQDPAQKTVNCELLIADSIESIVNKNTVYIVVAYIDDATDLVRYATSQASMYIPAPLDASTAGWSATTWGATQLTKKRISVQTPTAIKKDTAITVSLWSEISVDSELKIMFACPDVILA